MPTPRKGTPARVREPAAEPDGALRERFLKALSEDFRKHGHTAIEQLRTTRPADYLKAVSAHLPDEPGKPDALFAPYSDAELIAVFERLKPKSRAKGKARP